MQDVHIWHIDLTPNADAFERALKQLQPDELERTWRYVIERPRMQFALARASLRVILTRYIAQQGILLLPTAIEFGAEHRAKPTLMTPNIELKFNLSHSHHMGLLAVSRHGNLGVDVEYHDKKRDLKALTRTAFSPFEQEQMTPEDQATFFRIWTRKEAYLKAMGMGLSVDLKSFDVLGDSIRAALVDARHEGASVARWRMTGLDVWEGYSGALVHDLPHEIVLKTFAFTMSE